MMGKSRNLADAEERFVNTAGDTMTGALALPSLSNSGNLTFTGTGNRITGDFSNMTLENRVMFQTGAVDSGTNISVIPNGNVAAGNGSAHIRFEDSTSIATGNGSFGSVILVQDTEFRVQSIRAGTGTFLPMTFHTGGSESLRLSATSKAVTLAGGDTTANGTGITFPATQNASANANTLDDYEEGDWTPTLVVNGFNNSRTLSSASGTYTKVGRLVTVRCSLTMSGTCRPTSFLETGGLPFSAGAVFSGAYGAANAGAGIQGGSVMVYSNNTIIWYPSNGPVDSTQWHCSVTYSV